MFSIICYFSIISVVFAFNMSIYSGSNYYNNASRTGFQKLVTKYNFSYQPNDKLMMDVILKNAAPGVTATAFITQRLASNEKTGDTQMKNTTNCKGGLCLSMRRIILNTPSIFIGLQINQGSTTCWTKIFAEGNQTSSNNVTCVGLKVCVIEIDLQNECNVENKATQNPNQSIITNNGGNQKETIVKANEGAPSPSPSSSRSQSNKSMFSVTYIIISVIGIICVLILVICLFVKKYYHRNLKPTEMNSYLPSNEIIYADLGFPHENSRPPDDHPPRKAEEECPYAEIIGVMRPKN